MIISINIATYISKMNDTYVPIDYDYAATTPRIVRTWNQLKSVAVHYTIAINIGFLICFTWFYDTFCSIWWVYSIWIGACWLILLMGDNLTTTGVATVVHVVSMLIIIITTIIIGNNQQILDHCNIITQAFNISADCTNMTGSCIGMLDIVAPAYQNKVYAC